jgi:hypothetical protein
VVSAGFSTTALPAASAGGERRGELLRAHGQRRVPRGERGDHADRLLHGHAEILAARRRRLALERLADPGVVAEHAGGGLRLAARFALRLAVLAHLQGGELVEPRLDGGGDGVQHRGAPVRLPLPPAGLLQGRVAGGDGGADLVRRGGRGGADAPARRRVGDGEWLARAGDVFSGEQQRRRRVAHASPSRLSTTRASTGK